MSKFCVFIMRLLALCVNAFIVFSIVFAGMLVLAIGWLYVKKHPSKIVSDDLSLK